MKENKGKVKIGLFIFYGALTVFLLALILSFNDINAILGVLGTVDVVNILYAFLCIAVYMALYPLSLCILTRAGGHNVSNLTTYNIAMTEHFFNGITPFATGGQPFQVYGFSKAGVRVSDSTCLLMMNFMVFMLVTNGFALCALFFFKRFVSDTAMTVIAIVGFSMNFLTLGFTVLLAVSARLRALLSRFVDHLSSTRLLGRFMKPRAEALKEYFLNVQTSFSRLIKKKGAFLLALITKVMSMAAYYATTFFILRAFHVSVDPEELFYVIAGTSFAITMVVFLPTPGSSGGIEFAFKTVFAAIAGSAATVAYGGMLVWRLLSYYAVMLISLVFYIALEIGFSMKEKRRGGNL